MKITTTASFLLFVYSPAVFGLVAPSYTRPYCTAVAIKSKTDKMREEIAHELEELGSEIKPHIMNHDAKGFGVTESLIHKLRRELHERDHDYQNELKELRKEIQALSVAFTTDEYMIRECKDEIKDYTKENESVVRLLGQAVKLVARRIGNGTNAVLRFLRLKKKKQ